MNSGLIFFVAFGLVGNVVVYGCSNSGWSTWINDYSTSSTLFPNEAHEGIKTGGGDMENMNGTARETFCAAGHGSISSIECVTANGTNYIDAQGSKGLTCRVTEGFKCQNRIVAGGVCFDYKMRLFCNCTNPLVITTPSAVTKSPTNGTTAGSVTKSPTIKDPLSTANPSSDGSVTKSPISDPLSTSSPSSDGSVTKSLISGITADVGSGSVSGSNAGGYGHSSAAGGSGFESTTEKNTAAGLEMLTLTTIILACVGHFVT